MKTKLLFLALILFSFSIISQTDGWYLYTKPDKVCAIVPDDVNADILHLATDIGYIQYNTTTGLVTDFLNLTSQNPAIGHVNGLDLNPTNANIALALDDGIAIYNGTTVTIYNYDNSDLTVGSVGGSEFTNLEVRYGRQGELYIFKPDVAGYQVFNAGVFDPKVVTAIRPQDIVENQAGTKVYFAGFNDGLHELTKATTTWVNYTTSNSDLIYNVLHSLHVDSNDLLYIGGFQGLNTMTSGDVWNSYQQLAPPGNVFYYPVYDIYVNETSGDLLIHTSEPNTSYFGLSTLTLASNTWTNYTNDATNCLNENVFKSVSFGGDGMIYAAKNTFPENGSLFKFNHNTNTCSESDINYLNCPTAANSNLLSDFSVREKASGNLDIGFTRGENLHILEIDPNTFSGTFAAATTITPSTGKPAYSLLRDNDFFIVENNTGWVFVDGNNTTTEFAHGLPSYLAFVTKKTADYDSENGIINIVHKGFDAAFNIRVYKTQCDTAAGTCATSEEIFTTNRDLTQNVLFGVSEVSSSDNIHTVGISLDTSVSRNSYNNNTQLNSNLIYNEELWNKNTNGSAFAKSFALSDILFPNKDPLIFRANSGVVNTVLLLSDSKTIRTLTEDQTSNEIISRDFSIDQDNDGEPDEIINSFVTTTFVYSASGNPVLVSLVKNSNGTHVFYSVLTVDSSGDLIMENVMEQQGPISNNESGSLTVRKTLFVEESAQVGSRSLNEDTATIAMLTNYGLLIKTDVDLSQLTLSTGETIVQQNELLIYPNPSNDKVSFPEDNITSAAIYDSNGRHIKDIKKSSFSVKDLAKGVYIVKGINEENKTITKKLIKN